MVRIKSDGWEEIYSQEKEGYEAEYFLVAI